MSKLDKIAILLGAVGAIVLVVEEPMTGGSWAMPTAQAVAASPSSRVSPSRPYGLRSGAKTMTKLRVLSLFAGIGGFDHEGCGR